MHIFWKTIALICSLTFFVAMVWYSYFASVNNSTEIVIFTVPQDKNNFNLADSLYTQKLIKNKRTFNFLFSNFSKSLEAKEGGYKLSQSMTMWQIMKKLDGEQDLKWVNLFFCPRKEQVGEKLASVLGWNEQKLDSWNKLNADSEHFEGVYYPDTYLIPVDESVEETAKRFVNRFDDKISPLQSEFLEKNIRWTTGLKIASLIAREAAGKEDAKLISGIIWNRLNTDMRLQIDATMQYTLGKNEEGNWWGAIDLEEKRKDSPYNSYLHTGLPPTPICSPNIDFIEAALNPEETNCVFYLHSSNRQIHCAETYSEHQENIRKYL